MAQKETLGKSQANVAIGLGQRTNKCLFLQRNRVTPAAGIQLTKHEENCQAQIQVVLPEWPLG